MPNNAPALVGEHRRKRVRKGTRSCWECKRRKIKCRYESDDHAICAGCLEKGATCLRQEYVDDPTPHDAGSSALADRMERVETLLEKFMDKVSQLTSDRAPYGTVVALTPSSELETTNEPRGPVSPTFNCVLGSQAEVNTLVPPPQPVPVLKVRAAAAHSEGQPPGKIKSLRRQLAAMLPCQEDVDYLSDMSHGWWLIRQHMMLDLSNMPEHELQKPFDVLTVSKGHPMLIARLLLSVAICIQQLPPNIDPGRLRLKVPLREVKDKIITFVTSTVTSDDELTCSMEGIECFALQAIYQANAGSLRRAWLTYRKAVSVSQLLGIHRWTSKATQDTFSLAETNRQYIWYQIVQGERYLSLTLGIPSATTSEPLPFDDSISWLSSEDLYHKHLCQISGLILARNQGDPIHSFSTTQEIDEKLESLAKDMPSSWWDIPASAIEGRTDEASSQFERMMCQIWHFELATLVHLPFMLRAATDRRYEYSRISCLSASRGLIRRWLFIRETRTMTLFSNLVEFQAFTAAITVILGLLGPSHATTNLVVSRERYEDLQLVETVVQTLETLKDLGTGAHVVNQSISVIRKLQGTLRNDGKASGNLRLEIPHFGTISIARSGIVQSLDGERVLGANPRSRGTAVKVNNSSLQAQQSNPAAAETGVEPTWMPESAAWSREYQSSNKDGTTVNDDSARMESTVFQFTNSQFPTFETPFQDYVTERSWQEGDVIFFDSLFSADIEGLLQF